MVGAGAPPEVFRSIILEIFSSETFLGVHTRGWWPVLQAIEGLSAGI